MTFAAGPTTRELPGRPGAPGARGCDVLADGGAGGEEREQGAERCGAIMRRLGAPRRMISALEGEGLFTDATALVAHLVALTAVVAGSFSLAHAAVTFVAAAAGGIAIGIVVGRISAEICKRTADDQLNVTLSLLRGPDILPARTRLQGHRRL